MIEFNDAQNGLYKPSDTIGLGHGEYNRRLKNFFKIYKD